MHVSLIAVDFDFTLACFIRGFEGLLDIFERRGVPSEVAARAYQEAEDERFTLDLFLSKARQRGYPLPDEEAIRNEFREWLRVSLSLYPECSHVLDTWRRIRPIAIVTFGEPNYQRLKIEMSGIFYDMLYCVERRGRKAEAIQTLLPYVCAAGEPLLFIDDDPRELDGIRNAGIGEAEVLTVRMRRPESPHLALKSAHAHIKVASLNELDAVIQFSGKRR